MVGGSEVIPCQGVRRCAWLPARVFAGVVPVERHRGADSEPDNEAECEPDEQAHATHAEVELRCVTEQT